MATMATSLALFLPAFSLLLLASSAVARPGLPFHPCKTLLVSTYSVSFQPRNPRDDRPGFFAVVAEVREFHPKPQPLEGPGLFLRADEDRRALIRRPEISLGSGSLHDRTVDVLNVLASLLLGAACGALTAATMFLIWSLFNRRFEAYRSLDGFSDDDDDNDDDIFNPTKVHGNSDNKEVGNVAVRPVPSLADSSETALLKKESA